MKQVHLNALVNGGFYLSNGGRWASAHPLRGEWPWRVLKTEEGEPGYWDPVPSREERGARPMVGCRNLEEAMRLCAEWVGMTKPQEAEALRLVRKKYGEKRR